MNEINNNETALDLLILDGYVDEPSLLGVPPYISTEPRLIAGVAEKEELKWDYITADDYRKFGLPESEILLVHGGVTVPGKYLSGTPLKAKEAEKLAKEKRETYLGGPLAKYYDISGFDHYSVMDLSAYFYESLKGNSNDRYASLSEREEWLKKGSKVVKEHPMFPDPLIAEISMYRGCTRYFTGGCSFCSEPQYGKPDFRDQEDVIDEIKELYDAGVRNFRVGGQSCTVSYKAKELGEREAPKPRPKEIKKLFNGIWGECPEIKVLHLDNANPSVIASWPERSKDILKTFTEKTTAGNILALGLESADEKVIEKNNLNSTPEEVQKAVKIINEVGSERGENGMPKLLPGINFLGGLKGETPKTYEKNFEFLKKLVDGGYLLRRINIRQVLSHEEDFEMRNRSEFMEFKKKVREEVDRPMLKKILPKGTVLKDVYMEKSKGKKTFGRQVGTYPLLVGVEYPLELEKYYDVIITDYGYRSVTGITHPFKIDEASFEELKAVPGIGEKRASKIFQKKPANKGELEEVIEDEETLESLMEYVNA